MDKHPLTAEAIPDPSIRPLLFQLGFTRFVLQRNLEGIGHEESLRSPAGGGNCLHWVVGHLVATRNRWLHALGEAPFWSEEQAAPFRRGGAPAADPSALPRLEELWTAFDAAQDRLIAAMGRLSPEQLASPAPFSPSRNPDETIGSLMAGLCFHEAYHVGQTGLLRRVLGHPGAIA